jgi:hypothetical protein
MLLLKSVKFFYIFNFYCRPKTTPGVSEGFLFEVLPPLNCRPQTTRTALNGIIRIGVTPLKL